MENTKRGKGQAKSLRLLYWAGILSIVSAVAVFIGSIALAVGGSVGVSAEAKSGNLASLIGAAGGLGTGGVILLVSVIIMIISSIMQIVALIKVSGLHANYRIALILVAINVVLQSVISFTTLGGNIFSAVLTAVAAAVNLAVAYFVITAAADFLNRQGNKALADKGISVRRFYVICVAIVIVSELLALIPGLATVLSVITLIASVVQIVALFKYLGFLGKSAKALED